MEYSAAFAIQAMFRRFRRRKNGAAADIITNFLKMLAAKQAICRAVWAISVMRRFAKQVSRLCPLPLPPAVLCADSTAELQAVAREEVYAPSAVPRGG